MPVYIFWVFSGEKGTGRPVLTVEKDYWSDWLELKDMLCEAALKAWFMYKADPDEMIVAIDRLKYRPKRMAFRGYRQERMPFRREHRAIFKVAFNPRTRQITVKTAQLTQEFSSLIDEYYAVEKGIKWRSPPVIPKRKRDLKHILMMESGPIVNSYIPSLKPQYDLTEDQKYWEGKTTYAVSPKRQYT